MTKSAVSKTDLKDSFKAGSYLIKEDQEVIKLGRVKDFGESISQTSTTEKQVVHPYKFPLMDSNSKE